MTVRYFVLAFSVTTDRESNNVSLTRIIEEVQFESPNPLPQMPLALAVPFQATAAASFEAESDAERKQGKIPIQFWIQGPKPESKDLMGTTGIVDFQGKDRTRLHITIPHFPYVGDGTYLMKINYPTAIGKQEADWPVEVTFTQVPQAAAPA